MVMTAIGAAKGPSLLPLRPLRPNSHPDPTGKLSAELEAGSLADVAVIPL